MDDVLLSVRNLEVSFFTYEGVVEAVDGVSFDVRRNEILGLVGESGSGKSATALAVLRLVEPPGRIVAGEVWLDGEDLLCKTERQMRSIRGRHITMILQNPRAALNPLETVGDQIARVFQRRGLGRKAAQSETLRVLEELRMPDLQTRLSCYPHQLSGGMCQRVLIAMMTAPNPELLIADEPTTALDATIEAQVLDLIRRLHSTRKSSVLYITHDMGVIAEMCDRVAVMHAGHIVELADTGTLFSRPLHPYTRGLLSSILRVDRASALKDIARIKGVMPSLINPPRGCRFSGRCSYELPDCSTLRPSFREVEPGHWVLCREEVIDELGVA
jgi:peptide/nickel transport system ATP-binding protein